MRIIVITWPEFLPHEAERIVQLLDSDVYRVHIRKPGSTREDCARLLAALPERLLGRIVLHDHFELCSEWPVAGVHLNRRNPEPPAGWQGSLSCSCHSLEELAEKQGKMDYCFLSPIYDSISKQGYRAGFTAQQLREAADKGIINDRVGALGGVRRSCIPELERLGFGYAVLMGEVWKEKDKGSP
jgi:thiamine-phosphate pyrophosphorylase